MARLEVDIAGNLDGLKKSISEAEGRLKSFSDSATSIGKTLTVALTTPIVAIGAVSVNNFGKVEKGLREINTLFGLTGDAADQNLSKLTQQAEQASKELGILQTDVVPGLYNAISAGVPPDNALDFIRVAGRAAIGGVTDLNTSVDGLTSIVNAFNLDFQETEKVADSVFAAIQGGKTTFEEISAAIFNVAPAAAAAKVAFTEVNAAIATLTASGTPTSVATTQIRAALTGLQRPSEELDKIFQSLGFQSAQFALEQKGLGFALKAVKDATNGNNGELQKLLGSVEAVAAANVIAGTGAEKFSQELERQANAAGAAANAFEEVDKSFSRQIERTLVTINNLSISIGEKLAPAIGKLNSFLQSVLSSFENLSDRGKNIAIVIAGIAAAIGPVLIAVGSVVKILPILTAGFTALRVAVIAATGPFGLIAIAITAATALIFKLNSELRRTKEIAGEVRLANLDETTKNIKNEVDGLAASYIKINSNLTQNEAKQRALNSVLESYKTRLEDVRNTDPGNLNRISFLNDQIKAIESLKTGYVDLGTQIEVVGTKTATTLEQFSKIADIKNEEVFRRWAEEANKFNQELDESIKLQQRLEKAVSNINLDPKIVEIDLKLNLPNEETAELDTSFTSRFMAKTKEFGDQINSILQNAAGSAIGDFAFSIGQAIGNGANIFESGSAALLKVVADVANKLGQAAIGIGVSMLAIKAAFKNPFTAIAAGVALVALSGFISSQIPKITSGGSAISTSGGGQSQDISGRGSGLVNQSSMMQVEGDFTLRGEDLVTSIRRTEQRNRRG